MSIDVAPTRRLSALEFCFSFFLSSLLCFFRECVRPARSALLQQGLSKKARGGGVRRRRRCKQCDMFAVYEVELARGNKLAARCNNKSACPAT